MLISVIIPTLNEAKNIQRLIESIRQLSHARQIEIIVSDGGSHDQTQALAKDLGVSLIKGTAGRGRQLAAGANAATGKLLLFVHADTLLPDNFDEMLHNACESRTTGCWGFFRIRLSGKNILFRPIEFMMNLRSWLTHVSTGDQCQFVSRELYKMVGGYRAMPLMEDIELSKRLRKIAAPFIVKQPVITSTRRWETHGIIKTVLLMWWLRALFFFGVSPDKLKQMYV